MLFITWWTRPIIFLSGGIWNYYDKRGRKEGRRWWTCTFYSGQHVRQSCIIKTICKYYLNHPVNRVWASGRSYVKILLLILWFSLLSRSYFLGLAHLSILGCLTLNLEMPYLFFRINTSSQGGLGMGRVLFLATKISFIRQL